MSELNFNTMLHAYAAGSLDREELVELIEHIRQGGPLSQKELGELQNVISLLPTILELEHPQPQVKDKIARKLYRLRDELRAKRQTEIRDFSLPPVKEEKQEKSIFEESVKARTRSEEPLEMDRQLTDKFELKEPENIAPRDIFEEEEFPPSQPYQSKQPLYTPASGMENEEEEEKQESGNYTPQSYTAETYDAQSYSPQSYTPQDYTPQDYKTQENTELPGITETEEPRRTEKTKASEYAEKPEAMAPRRSVSIIYSFFVLIFSALMAAGVYYLLTGEIKNNRAQIASLNSQISSLNEEINRLEKNQKVSALINSRDAKVINLDGTLVNTNGFGRLTLSGDLKEGVIRFYNMPKLTREQVYQLWLTSRGQAFPLGTFKVNGDGEYHPVNPLPDIPPANMESFIVTLEEGTAATPSGSIYLSSATSQRARRRAAQSPSE